MGDAHVNGATLTVGGTKGHILEEIDGPALVLYNAYDWKMIPKCTGRYTCRTHSVVSVLTPRALLERVGIDTSFSLKEYEFALPDRPDKVQVIPLDCVNQTGLISYVKTDSTAAHYVHTLNTRSGFRRKLEAIGIAVTDAHIQLKSP
jgi:hypothetical protein